MLFPESSKWGTEVEHYDHSYIQACVPSRFDLSECAKLCESLNIFVSDSDQTLDINKYRNYFKHHSGIEFLELTGLSHIGLVTSPKSSQTIADHLTFTGTKLD